MEYPPETRAAVLAAVASGQSLRSIAREFGISRRTITGWADQAHVAMVAPQKKQALGELVYELTEGYLKGLLVQVRVTSEEDWIRQQSADSLAILHGVFADKLIRILGAIRSDAPADDGTT